MRSCKQSPVRAYTLGRKLPAGTSTFFLLLKPGNSESHKKVVQESAVCSAHATSRQRNPSEGRGSGHHMGMCLLGLCESTGAPGSLKCSLYILLYRQPKGQLQLRVFRMNKIFAFHMTTGGKCRLNGNDCWAWGKQVDLQSDEIQVHLLAWSSPSSVTPSRLFIALFTSFCYASMKGAMAFLLHGNGGTGHPAHELAGGHSSESRDSCPTCSSATHYLHLSGKSPEKLTCTVSIVLFVKWR